MRKLTHRLCPYPGCGKYAHYGHPEQKGRYCIDHKSTGMIDINNSRCQLCHCRAIWGHPRTKKTHCRLHRTEGMVTYPSYLCTEAGCRQRSTMGYISRTHCKDHARAGMYDFDVYCTEKCKRRACYGIIDPQRCKAHALEGDKRLIPTICDYPGCLRRASYASGGQPPQRCKTHIAEGMINVTSGSRSRELLQLSFSNN